MKAPFPLSMLTIIVTGLAGFPAAGALGSSFGLLLAVVCVIVVLWAFINLIVYCLGFVSSDGEGWRAIWPSGFGLLSFLRIRRLIPLLIPLRECAQIAYEQTRESLAAEMADREADDPEYLLKWYALALVTGADGATLYGKHPPDRRYEIVPQDKLPGLWLTEDLEGMTARDNCQKLEYKDLAMKLGDLKKQVEVIRSWG